MEKWLRAKTKEELIPIISEFIKIPNQSRMFDAEWATNGLQEKACQLAIDFAKSQKIKGLSIDFLQEEGKTPALLAVVEPFSGTHKMEPYLEKTILMYGHIDKQPPLHGKWSEGLGPHTPVIRDGKLYGRGGNDDGYAWFSCVLLAKALQENNLPHCRLVFFFETDEESGSRDLMYYLAKHKSTIGNPSLIFCLDSGTTDYEHMCLTTTLRGLVVFRLRVEVLKQGLHSGSSSGVAPSSYRILGDILKQFENSHNGDLPKEFYVDIPEDNYQQASDLIKAKGGMIDFKFPMTEGLETMGSTGFQDYLNRIWRPQLSITGIDGLPPCSKAGNVLLPYTEITCSMRLPPSKDAQEARKQVAEFFSKVNVPHNAKFTYDVFKAGTGFMCPSYSKSLLSVINKSGSETFNKQVLYYGEGGSIPFLNDIKNVFPEAQFIVTGVLGPESNAHGPDEMLHLGYLENLVVAMGKILRDAPKVL
jgi:acetylornithine deacetylase/succinyl-diaminopimelate desuccinylase-like protein